MTERVVSISGKTVEVAAPGSSADMPVATATTLGAVMVGDALECSPDGKLAICPADPIDDLYYDQPEDYSAIAAALMAIQGQYNDMLAKMRAAGFIKERE